MEADRNPFPRMSVIDVGQWLADRLSFLPPVPLSRGDHVNTGAAPMLDRALDEPQLPFEGRLSDFDY